MPPLGPGGASNAGLHPANNDRVRESVQSEGEANSMVLIKSGWGGGIASESGGEANCSQLSRWLRMDEIVICVGLGAYRRRFNAKALVWVDSAVRVGKSSGLNCSGLMERRWDAQFLNKEV